MKRNLISFLIMMLFAGQAFAAQHDYSIANGPGATVRTDINDAFSAVASNNSGATEPSSTFPNMWWMDTSTNILKQRTNANDAWVNVASKSGTTWIPYRSGTLIGTVSTLTSSTDGTLAANSDSNVATQKATKTYADTKISKTTSGEVNALTEKTSVVDNDIFLIEDSAASYAKKKVKKSNIGSNTGVQIFTSSGTFTAPSGITKVYVSMVGGGGGGGGAGSQPYGGGGAGGAFTIYTPFSVTPGNNYTVTIGSGGPGGADQNTVGSVGGSTSFDSLSVAGGSGGLRGIDGGTGGVAVGGMDASGITAGTYAQRSGAGGTGSNPNSGGGGGTPFGSGAAGRSSAGAGNNATANTGAGGGGAHGGGGSINGGNGASGLVIVEW